MIKTDIIWFIEHISRELDVAAVVSVLLQKKYGKSVQVIHYNSSKVLNEYSPSIVLLPFCYSIKDPSLGNCLLAWPEAIFFNLAWEQIFYQANLEYKAPRDDFAKKYVVHHAWSRKRNVFLTEKGVPQKHIFTNGHPAFGLYQKPYRDLYLSRTQLAGKFNLDDRKKWLFFPENYSWYFYSDHNLKEIIRQGQSEKVVFTMKRYCGDALKLVLAWLNDAVEIYKDNIEIILRPRPAFNLTYFIYKIKKLYPSLSPRLHIIKDLSVREWILASDFVISSFSTSLIEAAIAQKPVRMLEPISVPDVLQADWYKLVPKIRRKKDFLNLLENIKPDRSYEQLLNWAKKEFFVTSDPIMGLVDFLGKFRSLDYINIGGNKKNINRMSLGQNTLWKRMQVNIINMLGSLKRQLFNDRLYHINDDQKRYEEEIDKKIKIYRKFFKL